MLSTKQPRDEKPDGRAVEAAVVAEEVDEAVLVFELLVALKDELENVLDLLDVLSVEVCGMLDVVCVGLVTLVVVAAEATSLAPQTPAFCTGG